MFKPSRIVGSSPTDGKNIIRGLLPSQEVTTDLSKEELDEMLKVYRYDNILYNPVSFLNNIKFFGIALFLKYLSI